MGRVHTAAIAVGLALTGLVAAVLLLPRGDQGVEAPTLQQLAQVEVGTVAAPPAATPTAVGTSAQARHAAQHEGSEPTGTTSREARLADRDAEEAMARVNREQRLADNITSLQAAAARAESEGNAQRAELMYRRIEMLEELQDQDASGSSEG